MRSPTAWLADPAARRRLAPPATAALLAAAAGAHFSVAAAHFHEWWLFGAFFVVAGATQILCALAVAAGHGRRLATVIGWGSLAVAVLWLLTRTSGLPVGPEHWSPESPSWLDVGSTAAELATAALCFGCLAPRRTAAPSWWRRVRTLAEDTWWKDPDWDAAAATGGPIGDFRPPQPPPPPYDPATQPLPLPGAPLQVSDAPLPLPDEEDNPWASV